MIDNKSSLIKYLKSYNFEEVEYKKESKDYLGGITIKFKGNFSFINYDKNKPRQLFNMNYCYYDEESDKTCIAISYFEDILRYIPISLDTVKIIKEDVLKLSKEIEKLHHQLDVMLNER